QLRSRPDWTADTYDGVKLAPEEVRSIVVGAGLEIVDEWGLETHYHWVTARKPGEDAAVRLSTRVLDVEALADVFRRAGTSDPEGDAARVARGEATLRGVLAGLETRLAGLADEALVVEAYRVLLGTEPDPSGRAFHLAN